MTVVQFSEYAGFFAITSRQARPASYNQEWIDKTDWAWQFVAIFSIVSMLIRAFNYLSTLI